MEIMWISPDSPPVLARGRTVKVWGVADIYRHTTERGGTGADGKAERIHTVQEVKRQVIELYFSNTSATPEELARFREEGEFPASAPGWLDEWLNEDGDFCGVHGFYHEYTDDGRVYFQEFKAGPDGRLQTPDGWGCNPGMVLLAWARYEIPDVPATNPARDRTPRRSADSPLLPERRSRKQGGYGFTRRPRRTP